MLEIFIEMGEKRAGIYEHIVYQAMEFVNGYADRR